jgi:hypothetical protein
MSSLILQHGIAHLDIHYPQALFSKGPSASPPSRIFIMTQIEIDTCWVVPSIPNEATSQLRSQYGNDDGPVHNVKATKVMRYQVDTVLSMMQPITLICLPFILTYLFTLMQSISAQKSKKIRKKAPVVPYTVPIVGHAMMFVWSLNRLIKKNS